MKWQYTVPNHLAEGLRSAIENEDIENLCDYFTEIAEWIKSNVPDSDFDIDGLLDETEYWDTEDEDFFDEIDYCLGELYDICDAYRIWIPV